MTPPELRAQPDATLAPDRCARYRPAGFARAIAVWAVLLACAVAALVVALFLGSSDITIAESFAAIVSPNDSLAATAVWQLRMPRALAAFGTGGLLAVAGCLMQVLLRNPLADPYILGLSSGAAVGALGAMLLGAGLAAVTFGAAGGALASSVLVFALANRDLARLRISSTVVDSPRLILTGVMLAAGWSAIVTLILVLAPERNLRGMLFWAMGDLGGVDRAWPALVALALIVAVLAPFLRQFNVLLRGDAVAATLGVRVAALKSFLFVAASLATAVAVTTAGTIGFVGLVVPHALRLVVGNDQRVLVPACAIAGGGLLVVADTIARTIVDPLQLPVGVVTAFIGVPAFLSLLLRTR
jgi:iron complex transport system permease protein